MSTVRKTNKDERPPRAGKRVAKAGKIAALSLGGLMAFAVIAVTAVTLWLTPSRLTSIVNREASRYLDADVRVSDLRFTIWSSFPYFYVEADSARVMSRSLNGISRAQRDSLPADADFLMSSGKLRGAVNVLSLLKGDIALRNVEVADLDLNLVALNDSLSNFNIVPPESRGSFEIPHISADTIRLSSMRPLRYYSAATSTTLTAPVKSAMLVRTDRDCYRLLLQGDVSLVSGPMEVLRNFPFALDGRLATRFHPFSLQFSDFNVGLANVNGKVKMDMSFGDNPGVDGFSYDITEFNPLDLISYFPGLQAPFLRDVKADVGVVLSARLLKPYHFAASALPDLAVDFKTSGGTLRYTFADGSIAEVKDILLDGRFTFDGENPARSDVRVNCLAVRGDGSEITASGALSNLLGNPEVDAIVKGHADLADASRMLASLRPYGLKGGFDCDTRIRFTLSEATGVALTDIKADGTASLTDFSISGKGMKGKASGLKVRFDGTADNISSEGISGLKGDVAFDMSKADLSAPDLKVAASGVHFKGSAGMAKGADLPLVEAVMSMRSFAMSQPNTAVTLDSTAIALHTMRGNKQGGKRGVGNSVLHPADEAALRRVAHTPEYLSVRLPENVRKIYGSMGFTLDAQIASGELRTPSFPVVNTFRNLSFFADNDRVALHNLGVRSQSSGMTVSGEISGLHRFLLSGLPTVVTADLNIALDTVNINQLAHAYARGLVLTKGTDASLSAPKPVTLTRSDTTAMLIPRNIVANVKASAKETVYTNLHLYDLATQVKVADGNARVDDLRIDSDFGHAFLSLAYRSQDVLDMGVDVKAGLEDIDVVRFFERFHTLLLMMPQMRNLSGMVSADADMNLHIYPDMDADVPSLTANVKVSGRGLTVHQDPFIRHITKMMMIHTSGDLHIADMDVRASVHDNLLELYPFDFEFDRYRLRMEGLNNFNGRMYYHVGVEKSPVPFPFGINIQGMFSHPEFRFGGAVYKVDKGAEVASEVMEDNSFNIIRELKYYLQEFVRKAAESDNTPDSVYLTK